jgi:hypothetical protein
VKKDRSVSGKNEAAGDTIHILFDAQKNAVKSLKLLGSATMASGRYIDMEKTERLKREAEAAKAAESLKLESGDKAPSEKTKSRMDMMRKIREKAIAPAKDL